MDWFDILLLFGLAWLLIEVRRLRARVLDLEQGESGIASQRVVSANAGTSTSGGLPVSPALAETAPSKVAQAKASPTIHRGSRVRGNDKGRGGGDLLERLVGGRLLIWVGGVALALGGVFLVRYSIEVGLIGPGVRMGLAAALGLAFLAGGEAARARLADEPRVAQALVGAGVLVLYATAYGAHRLYGFYGVGTAFALLSLVAAAGLGLSLRHGPFAAALGLVGGLATPALVGEAGAVLPLLGYLLALNAAVLGAASARGWGALLGAAVLGTAFWVVPLAVTADQGEALAVGVFALAYAVAATVVLDRSRVGVGPRWLATATRPAALGLIQLAVLQTAQVAFAPGWLLYAALSAVVLGLSRADRLPWLPLSAAVLGTALMWAEMPSHIATVRGPAMDAPSATGPPSPWLIGVGLLLLFAPVSAWRVGGRTVWTGVFAVAIVGPALVLRAGASASDLPRVGWGVLLLALALLPAALAWRVPASDDARRAGLFATAATAAGVGVTDLFTPVWTPPAWALLALALAGGARWLDDAGAARVAAAVAGVALLGSLAWLGAAPDWPGAGQATAVLAVPGALVAGVALLTREAAVRRGLWVAAGLAGLGWAGVLAWQLSGLARVSSFLALGLALMVVGWVWGRKKGERSV